VSAAAQELKSMSQLSGIQSSGNPLYEGYYLFRKIHSLAIFKSTRRVTLGQACDAFCMQERPRCTVESQPRIRCIEWRGAFSKQDSLSRNNSFI